MITLYSQKELLIQIHKTKVALTEPTCLIRISSSFSDDVLEVTGYIQELAFCYVIRLIDAIEIGSTKAKLQIVKNDAIIFESDLDIK